MQPDVVTVPPSLSVEDLVENYIYRLHHKMFPVTDGDRLLGCVTTRNVQQVPRSLWSTTTVAHISDKCEQQNTIASTNDAMGALTQMNRNGSSRLMVVDGDRLVGMLSLSDLLKFIFLKMELEDDASTGSEWLSPDERFGGNGRSLNLKETSEKESFLENVR